MHVLAQVLGLKCLRCKYGLLFMDVAGPTHALLASAQKKGPKQRWDQPAGGTRK